MNQSHYNITPENILAGLVSSIYGDCEISKYPDAAEAEDQAEMVDESSQPANDTDNEWRKINDAKQAGYIKSFYSHISAGTPLCEVVVLTRFKKSITQEIDGDEATVLASYQALNFTVTALSIAYAEYVFLDGKQIPAEIHNIFQQIFSGRIESIYMHKPSLFKCFCEDNAVLGGAYQLDEIIQSNLKRDGFASLFHYYKLLQRNADRAGENALTIARNIDDLIAFRAFICTKQYHLITPLMQTCRTFAQYILPTKLYTDHSECNLHIINLPQEIWFKIIQESSGITKFKELFENMHKAKAQLAAI